MGLVSGLDHFALENREKCFLKLSSPLTILFLSSYALALIQPFRHPLDASLNKARRGLPAYFLRKAWDHNSKSPIRRMLLLAREFLRNSYFCRFSKFLYSSRKQNVIMQIPCYFGAGSWSNHEDNRLKTHQLSSAFSHWRQLAQAAVGVWQVLGEGGVSSNF